MEIYTQMLMRVIHSDVEFVNKLADVNLELVIQPAPVARVDVS